MPSLQFKGKTFVDNQHLSAPFHELRPFAGKGAVKTASLHDNLVVHGDKLAALKAGASRVHESARSERDALHRGGRRLGPQPTAGADS